MPSRFRSTVFCIIAVCLFPVIPSAPAASKPSVWIKLRSPNFIVVTNGSEKQARHVAYQFEMIRSVFRNFFSSQVSKVDPPVVIIATKDEETLKPLLPGAYQVKGATHLAGIFVGGPEKNYVAIRLDVSLDQDSDEPFEPVYHEYLHYMMRRSISRIPLWLSEGLAEFYGNTRVESKRVLVGTPSTTNLRVLHEGQMLPLHTLFAVDAASPYYHEENKASIFYAESWVLTHYLMTNDWRAKTNLLQQFVNLIVQNVAPDEAAKRTIGDPHKLESALEHYIKLFSFTVARVPPASSVNEEAFTPQPLSDAESLAVRADFLLHTHHDAEAKAMLEQSLKEDPKLAASHESMGFYYSEQHKTDEANKWYSQAVELNTDSYLTNYYYATNLFSTSMDDAAAAKAEAGLRAAIRINPDFAPAYDALAYLFLLKHRELQEARTMTLHAVSLEPGNIHYRVRMVEVLEQLNLAADAIRVATLATSMARNQNEIMEAEMALNNARKFEEYSRLKNDDEQTLRQANVESTEHPKSGGEGDHPAPGGPPVLQHRDVARVGYGKAEVLPPPSRQRGALEAQTKSVDGTIFNATCPDSKTLELTLTTPKGALQLYSDNYYQVGFSALNFTPDGIMNPCHDLKGMQAVITYHPVKDHPERGEIDEVQVSK